MENILWSIGHELKLKNITHARGCYVFDADGNSYLDMESGVWCTPLGHCHQDVNHAVQQQMAKIMHTGYCYAHPVIQKTARSILEIIGMENGKCVFLTSGSEAVEVGVKAIKTISAKPLLLTFSDSFLGSVGSSGNKPLNEWFLFDWHKCEACASKEKCDPGCSHFSTIPFEKIAGFVFEPGSSSGMVRFPPKSLITQIDNKIHDSDGFVQVNEITTGMGRTGKWFGFMHYDIVPDIVSIGKGLGNGYPISAVAFNLRTVRKMEESGFYHSQSHQNDPLGCAAANAVIKIMKEEGVIEACNSAAAFLKEKLTGLARKHKAIKEIRGRGLMMAVEFSEQIGHDKVISIYEQLLKKGFIVAKRPKLKVFRIDPPLIIGKETIDGFIHAFDAVISEISL